NITLQGVVLWEITARSSPYFGMSNVEVIEEVCEKGFRLKQPKNCSNAIYEVMLNCWQTEPSRRPDIGEIYTRLEAVQEEVRKQIGEPVDVNVPEDKTHIGTHYDDFNM